MKCEECDFIRRGRTRVPYGDTTATISEEWCLLGNDPTNCTEVEDDEDCE